MFYNNPANRRIQSLIRILKNVNPVIGNSVRAYTSSDSVSIGEVTKVVNKVKRPEYVPRNYYREDLGQSTLHHLRWMMQKDLLGQDIFLLGPPGPQKRNLAMQYLELTNREHEYVALSRDTTESDLKQRREIVKGTAKYFDQSAVRAATEGRILILEGVEKAERNVLPVLNNLLENREMHLEDGRLLIPASRYDKLLEQYGKEELDKWKLMRVDENFRVIALGLPVPKYRGNPLDPPLRSRFQARDVCSKTYQECHRELRRLAPEAPLEKVEKVLSCAFAISTNESANLGFPDFPKDNLPHAAKMLEQNPQLPGRLEGRSSHEPCLPGGATGQRRDRSLPRPTWLPDGRSWVNSSRSSCPVRGLRFGSASRTPTSARSKSLFFVFFFTNKIEL
jgi:hypothetical protein